MEIILEADPSMWRAFGRLSSEAKDVFRDLLTRLQAGNWLSETSRRVEGVDPDVFFEPLPGGWICDWIPVPKHPQIQTIAPPERIIVCLHEQGEINYLSGTPSRISIQLAPSVGLD